jgi:hypothetical protein
MHVLRMSLCVLAALVPACGAPSTAPDPEPPAGPGPALNYQFDAKFEPPAGRVVHGMGQWGGYNPKYQALLPPDRQPAAELGFIPIGDTERPWQPAKIAQSLAAMSQAGRIPLLDIGLRGNQPSQTELAGLEDKLYGIDDEVASGTAWDQRLQDLVQVLRDFRRPVMVRIGGEFNGWWNGYHPWEFPKAFRKIVQMFRAAGVDNAAFIWCYEPAAPEDFDARDSAGNWKWYPGADVVDWFSIDLFAKGDVSGPAGAHGSLTGYGRTLKFLDMAVAARRPVVIAESAPSQYDLSGAASAQAAWTEWFAPYFALIATRPEIKWFHYINYDWEQAAYYVASGWKNNDLSAAPAIASLYSAELAKPKYLHAGETAKLKDYSKYQ